MFCVFIAALLVVAAYSQTRPRHRVLFNRFRMPEVAIFAADPDGRNERPLVPHRQMEYSPSISLDGKWVAFTSEVAGQSDIWRVHSDGSGLEQLTNDPSFDDQGTLSPDGSTLAFVSTREGGTANLWLLNLEAANTGISTATPPAVSAHHGRPTADGSPSVPTLMQAPP